jgi:hypothetical protein
MMKYNNREFNLQLFEKKLKSAIKTSNTILHSVIYIYKIK